MSGIIGHIAATLVTGLARAVTGVRGDWRDAAADPDGPPRIYFANHASHGDFVLVWTVLPRSLRRRTRPVAGADYWNAGPIRRFFGQRVFQAVLIDRRPEMRSGDPLAPLADAIGQGQSLILFPEGTRNLTEERLLPFKSGLYHLARMRPEALPVPVWIENLNRVMPKGELVPVPLLCTVTFGAPLPVAEGEDKNAYLARARAAMLALAPGTEAQS
ncbi:acyltransferase-like protein [Stella humosa]|uniref:Acyltransferase-like protein n=1 Tax=Stella humosa TaxID=94 RepID=A0A3N1LJT6_9PROT|nr:lysophospholipid acyltransferase family protein [Stella humosa]ROP91128.1 acyltransferase-like protein [Stella humosa]BBK34520.1 1-acyl-sn-glycerol-3-phosphate acyltransferase [Stella humosa]